MGGLRTRTVDGAQNTKVRWLTACEAGDNISNKRAPDSVACWMREKPSCGYLVKIVGSLLLLTDLNEIVWKGFHVPRLVLDGRVEGRDRGMSRNKQNHVGVLR